MRTAVFQGDGIIAIEQVPDPEPAPDEVLVEVARCGICGSDVSMTSGSAFDYAIGSRLGHEMAGEVVAVGSNVCHVSVGDRVACMPRTGCGVCAICLDGRPLLCCSSVSRGGGFADFLAPKARSVIVLPNSLSLADGALVEPMACGLRALRQCRAQRGERILVLGAGAVALSVVFWARRLGAARVVVAARSRTRLNEALTFGADALHSLEDEDHSALGRLLGGPADIVAECVGKTTLLNLAINLVRTGGRVISLGMCVNSEPIIPARCARKEVSLFFPLGYSLDEFAETARAFDAGRVNPEILVSDVIPLDALPTVIAQLRSGRSAAKIQVDPRMECVRA